MGNACECVSRQTDDAEDALLASLDEDGRMRPRGPPPPYQPQAPLYAYPQMTEQQHLQLVQRITLIQALPCTRYRTKSSKGEEKQEKGPEKNAKGEKRECPICMMDFVSGDPIRLLPCMHFYHLRCVDDWLMRSFTCPSCMERVDVGLRAAIRSSSSHHSRGSRSDRQRTYSSSSVSSSCSSGSNPNSSGSSIGSSEHVQLLGHVVVEQSTHSRNSPNFQLESNSSPPPPMSPVSCLSPHVLSPVLLRPPSSPRLPTQAGTGRGDTALS